MMDSPLPLAVGEEPPAMDAPSSAPGRQGKPEHTPRDKSQPKGTAAGRRGAGERFWALNSFVDCTLRRLDRNELAVWMVLYRDARDGIARTSQADLAVRAGACERTVRRALARLVKRGLLEVVCRGRLQTGPSVYRLRPVEPDPLA